MQRRLFVIVTLSAILLGLPSARADMRTKPIKLVHAMTWDAQVGAISVAGVNNSDHEKALQFFEAMSGWVVKGFEKIGYTVEESAGLAFNWTLGEQTAQAGNHAGKVGARPPAVERAATRSEGILRRRQAVTLPKDKNLFTFLC